MSNKKLFRKVAENYPPPALILDLDGSLFNCEHRLHHVLNRPKNYPAFEAGIKDDTVYRSISNFVNELSINFNDLYIVVLTGRSENTMAITLEKLDDSGVLYDAIYMRKNKDYRKDTIVKQELLDEIFIDGYTPVMCIEDRDHLLDMFKSNFLLCFKADQGVISVYR